MSGGHNFVLPTLASKERIDQPMSFFVLERCLRRLDLPVVGYSPFHLSLLEMAVAATITPSDRQPSVSDFVHLILDFLGGQGLRRETLIVTYSGGGMLGDSRIDPDLQGRDAWIRAGVPPAQVIVVGGRRNIIHTGGQLHPIYGRGPRPAGLAHEIFWPVSNQRSFFVELASVNLYTHIQRGQKVEPALNKALGVGFGLERLAAIKGGFDRIFDVDSLSALLGAIRNCASGLPSQAFDLYRSDYERIADRIRTICFILSEGQEPDASPRGKLLTDLLKGTAKMADLVGIDLYRAFQEVLSAIRSYYDDVYPHVWASRSRVLDAIGNWVSAKSE